MKRAFARPACALVVSVGLAAAAAQPGAVGSTPGTNGVTGSVPGAQPGGDRPNRRAGGSPSSVINPDTVPATEQWLKRAKAFGGHEWVTRPSRDAIMGFTIPMEVAAVEVAGGQAVKKDQILVRGREGEAVASLAAQRIKSSNRAPVDSARANMDLAQIRFDAATKAQNESAMTDYEFQERRLTLAAAKAAHENAVAQLNEEQERTKQAVEAVERYRIRARFDGIVELVIAEPGQTIDIQQPVIRVVQVDPLWVDVPVPTEETIRMKLAENGKATVLLDVPTDKPEGVQLSGKILYVSPVVDAAGSRRVRVEVANPEKWPAGTRARVKFDGAMSSAPVGNTGAQAGAQTGGKEGA